MGSIAKGLIFGFPTGTPVVVTGLDIDDIRILLRYFGIGHFRSFLFLASVKST
jgi:hypothetical protein